MIDGHALANALVGLGMLAPADRHQILFELGPLANEPLRTDKTPDEALLAIGACAAFDHLAEDPMAMFLVARSAIGVATQSQIDTVAARQAAIPPGYDF